jgi:O-methyltransferase
MNKIKDFFSNLKFKLMHSKFIPIRRMYKYSDESKKFSHLMECVNYLRVAGYNDVLPMTYFEFGCHSGRTFSTVINAFDYFKIKNAKFFAFDSFSGLPKTDNKIDGIFKEGTFNTSLNNFKKILRKRTYFNTDDLNIFEGYYQNTLTTTLQGKLPKIGIVHIDVDLYSSTVVLLEFIKPLLVVGSVIIFDDWFCFPPNGEKGEMRAFHEFCNRYPNFKFVEWKNYSTFGKSLFVTSI